MLSFEPNNRPCASSVLQWLLDSSNMESRSCSNCVGHQIPEVHHELVVPSAESINTTRGAKATGISP